MFLRVVLMVALVNRALAASLALALGCMAAAGLVVSLVLWRRSKTHEKGVVTAGANPFELSEAIKFGLLFGIVTVVAKAAEVYLGATGLYLAGAVAGPYRCRCDCPLDGESRYDHSGNIKIAAAHNRHCGDFEYASKSRHGDIYGRACDAAYHRTGHVNLVHWGSGRDLDRMIDLLIHEPCNEPDFRSRPGGKLMTVN